jgi:hypothetical protein
MQNNVIEVNESNRKPSKKPWLMVLISFVGLVIIASSTSPKGGPINILIFWLVIFLLLSSSIYGVLGLVKKAILKTLSAKARMYISINFTLSIILILGLRSLGQLDFTDLILIISFELISNFYILRRF